MSGENAGVGGARRALAELTDPATGLVADLVAAEDGAVALEPDLLLLAVDLFGAITLPAGAARVPDRRGTSRAVTPLERLAAAAARPPAPAGAGVAPSPGGGAAGAGAAAGRQPKEPVAIPDSTATPVFRLAARSGSTPSAGAASPAAAARGAATPAGGAPSGAAAAATATTAAPGTAAGGSAPADAAEAAEGAVALIAELTASILAASGGSAVGAAAAGEGPAADAADAGRRSQRESRGGAAPESSLLEETVRSLDSETAAALGLEIGVPELRSAAQTGEEESAAGVAPPRAPGSPATARSPSPELLAPPAQTAAGVGEAPRPGEETDPAALAALVNEVLVEQARRHGLELA